MIRLENESAVMWLCRQLPVDANRQSKRMPGALGDVTDHKSKRCLFSSGYNFEADKDVAGKNPNLKCQATINGKPKILTVANPILS